MNFRIRENKLNMTVRMRSQDIIFGFSNDAACFSFIHEMIFVYLKDTYSDLQIGEYYHSADSFHIYERHFEMLEKIIEKEAQFTEIDCPKIENKLEVESLMRQQFNPSFNFSVWLSTR
jgi:thymidylate synthase